MIHNSVSHSLAYSVVYAVSPGTNSAGTAIAIVFSVLMHLVLGSAMLWAFITLIRLTFSPDSHANGPSADPYSVSAPTVTASHERELLLRVTALSIGALVPLGAQAAEISIPELLVNSLSLIAPVRFAVFGVGLPAVGGFLAAHYFGSLFAKPDRRALRMLIFLGSMTLTLFIEVYALAINSSGPVVSPKFVPSVSFVIAVGLYAIGRRDRDGGRHG
jgi:hypothetical protein